MSIANGTPPSIAPKPASEDGFTLIELLMAILIGTVVTMAAFAFLIFATEDASHITSRVGVDQAGRVAMQKLISELHSSCVAPSAVPILAGSSATVLIFVSETGESSAFSTVEKHEVIYTAASGPTEGTLVEKDYKSIGTTTQNVGEAPEYTWSKTPSTSRLLKGIKQTELSGAKTAIFSYYGYYKEGDAIPTGDKTLPFGEINPEAVTPGKEGISTTQSENITKVTVNFTLDPEGHESVSFNKDRPVVLEDSAVFRLAPASEATTNPNQPCAEQP
jgi:prepilin-type N-terminal cleavage/methylation domain-containing protein